MIAVSDLPGAHRVPFGWRLLAPRHWPTWAAVAFLRASLYLPLGARARMADILGRLYYRGNRKRRRIATINIGLCFPEWTPERRERLALHDADRQKFDDAVLDVLEAVMKGEVAGSILLL